MNDSIVRLGQYPAHLHHIRHSVAHHHLLVVDGDVGADGRLDVLPPIDLRHFPLQLTQRQFLVDGGRVVSVGFRQRCLEDD